VYSFLTTDDTVQYAMSIALHSLFISQRDENVMVVITCCCADVMRYLVPYVRLHTIRLLIAHPEQVLVVLRSRSTGVLFTRPR
jgi:hypothetical protein